MATRIDVLNKVTVAGVVHQYARAFDVDQSTLVNELAIPALSTDMEVVFAPGTLADIAYLLIYSDGALTIKANSSSVPNWTLTLAGPDVLELSGAAVAALAGATLTKLFVTNGHATEIRKLTCLAGGDITP